MYQSINSQHELCVNLRNTETNWIYLTDILHEFREHSSIISGTFCMNSTTKLQWTAAFDTFMNVPNNAK